MKDSAIVAELKSSVGDFAKQVYEHLSEKTGRFDLINIKTKGFRDGEEVPRVIDTVRRKRCYFIHDSAKKPKDWYFSLDTVNETLRNSSAKEVHDILPYFRFMRQDRKDRSRVCVTAKMVANSISDYADGIVTIDEHFPQLTGFFSIKTTYDGLRSFNTCISYLNENYPDLIKNCVVVSPDAGGGSRAESFIEKAGIENIAIGHKVRKNGKIVKHQLLGDVDGKYALIVDDIIDSGQSIVDVAKICKERGASKVYAYATHGLFTKGTDLEAIDHIFTTDTVYRGSAPNVEVISLAKLVADAIYGINEGESLSPLFKLPREYISDPNE